MEALTQLERAIAAIDAVHAQDPEQLDGRPAELVYAERMTAALATIAPSASDALRIAVRAQHLARWRTPRSASPEGKAGYHRWRTEQARAHAALARELLREVGYDDATIARVSELVRKADLARDPEAQALEDAACLVFLEHYAGAFAVGRDEAQLVDILRKTWRKMSAGARSHALALPLSEGVRALVARALG